MAERIYANENNPFPNNSLPILYYKNVLKDLLEESYSAEEVSNLLENNGYTNSWTGSIAKYHHFHTNTHEVLACIEGDAMIQLGGPDADIYSFRKGDVLVLPAGVAHKKLDSSQDFEVVGAYPNGAEPDMHDGNAGDYEEVVRNIEKIERPKTDPIEGASGPVTEYWQ